MFSNQKVKTYVIVFLVFCVASSKGIIIYNEETLVALSFISFVIFCFHYFGNTVKESLNERSSLIKSELENFSKQQEHGLNELLSELKRIAGLRESVATLGKFTEREIVEINNSQASTILLNNRFNNQIQQNIAQLESSKNRLQSDLQKSIHDAIYSLVICKMVRPGQNQSRSKLRKLLVNQVKRTIKLF